MPARSNSRPIGLADLISQVKQELMQPPSDDPTPTLRVDEIELEVAITVSKKGEAGINIQVVQLGGGAERSDVHTVRVKLLPLLSRDDQLALLRDDPQWTKIEEATRRTIFKSVDDGSVSDSYYAQPS